MGVTITHLEGPLAGQEQHFSDSVEVIMFGRSPDCQVVYPPECTEIGRKHFALRRNPPRDYTVELVATRYVEIDGILARNGQVARSGSAFVLGRPDGPGFSLRYASEMADIAWSADEDAEIDDLLKPSRAERQWESAVDLLFKRKSDPPAVVAGIPADVALQQHLERDPLTEMKPAPAPVRVGAADRPPGSFDPWFEDLLQGKHSAPKGVGSGASQSPPSPRYPSDAPAPSRPPQSIPDLAEKSSYQMPARARRTGALWWIVAAAAFAALGYFLYRREIVLGAAFVKLLHAAVPPSTARETKVDLVDVSVFGPRAIKAGGEALVQVFLHHLSQREIAKALAQEIDPEATRRGVQTLAAEIAEGQHVQILLEGRGLSVDQQMQTLVWRGEPCACQFTVTAPKDAIGRTFHPRVLVLVDSVPVGSLTFALKASEAETVETGMRGDRARRYNYAFLSYASPDRAEVLKRAQGLKAGGTNFFNDLLSLEPGERWEKRLYEEIDRCDVFYLFWSSHAKASEWVMKEIEHALTRRTTAANGGPDIVPVIIEGPPPPAPPDSLKDIQFNDSLIYVLAGV